MAGKPSILEVMKTRPVIGDGSYVITLEKRGYVKAGVWTPEAVIEYPEAGNRDLPSPSVFQKQEITSPLLCTQVVFLHFAH